MIEREARERLEGYVRDAAGVARGARGPDDGWFVAPTVVAGVDRDAPIAREELFGPVVVVETVSGIDDALGVLDGLPFGLTGGLFSRNPETVRTVVARVPVGNFYVNRHITGAMVGRQPFGGNRLSGTGTKAGGPGYLLQFVESRVVSENTMRHGLVAD